MWAAQNTTYNQVLPNQYDNLHVPENSPVIKISYPLAGQTIGQSSFVLQVQASAPLGIKQIDYFLNDSFLGSSFAPPYQFNVRLPDDVFNGQGQITLRARVYDTALNRQEDQITVSINH